LIDSSSDAPYCAGPDPSPAPPRHPLPNLACDSHMHICGPESRHRYAAKRIYTPPDALLTDYLHVTTALGLGRVVFVQPSVYSTDNTVMLDAMEHCPLPSRGVAVIDATISDATLSTLDQAGVRGVRFNFVDVANATTQLPLEPLEEIAQRIEPLGWHVELLVHVDDYPNLDGLLEHLPVDIVIGHLGYCRPGRSTRDEGFQALLRLMSAGRCWTKLTGPYRVAAGKLPYSSAADFARALVRQAPDRVLWGSDWPHVMVKSTMPNDGDLLDLLFDWVPDATIRRKILVDNAAKLYGF
jgi:2-pyrone-4,6-dicarboxylate lactonase